MKVGVILPTFRETTADAMGVARQVAESGLDGVFAYDHLWPMGSPLRPSFAPLPVLARVLQLHSSLIVGPLVARVGMVSKDHLVQQFRTLASLGPGRVIAALGSGDSLSRDELDAYGVHFASAAHRRELVRETALILRDELPVWIGGLSPETVNLARALGAEVNCWNAPNEVMGSIGQTGPFNWAGPSGPDTHLQLDDLASLGATWAIFAPGVDIEALAAWRGARND
jgi:alkanesulfonate monooxygenase SsuD/methylene tetrahydromethanopterin reductase-like flavin-dependent oxidoreductase (luciferase family)